MCTVWQQREGAVYGNHTAGDQDWAADWKPQHVTVPLLCTASVCVCAAARDGTVSALLLVCAAAREVVTASMPAAPPHATPRCMGGSCRVGVQLSLRLCG